jgi:SNF2 family DNA or RNA helicase
MKRSYEQDESVAKRQKITDEGVISLSKLISEKSAYIQNLQSYFKSRVSAEKTVLHAYLMQLREQALQSLPEEDFDEKHPALDENQPPPIQMKLPLYTHQLKALAFAEKTKRCILALEVGAGKTAIAIQAIVNQKQIVPTTTVLIVVPASLVNQWLGEIHKFSTLKAGLDYELTSYASLKSVQLKTYDIIIGDEAHYIKNPKSQRSKRFVKLSESTKMLLLLTGTPAESHDNLYHLLHVVHPTRFASQWVFRSNFCVKKQSFVRGRNIYSYTQNKNRTQLLTQCQDLMLSMSITDISDALPKLHTRSVHLNLKTSFDPEMSWMDQWRSECNLKLPLSIKYLRNYIREKVRPDEKICIFTFHVNAANEIYQELGGAKACCLFTGETDCDLAKREFELSSKSIAVLTMSSSATGLNLQRANHLIFAELSPDSILMKQASGRVYRMGQSRETHIISLIGAEMDHQITSKLHRKKSCADEILDACKV